MIIYKSLHRDSKTLLQQGCGLLTLSSQPQTACFAGCPIEKKMDLTFKKGAEDLDTHAILGFFCCQMGFPPSF